MLNPDVIAVAEAAVLCAVYVNDIPIILEQLP